MDIFNNNIYSRTVTYIQNMSSAKSTQYKKRYKNIYYTENTVLSEQILTI